MTFVTKDKVGLESAESGGSEESNYEFRPLDLFR
jgi:hypothetical protein